MTDRPWPDACDYRGSVIYPNALGNVVLRSGVLERLPAGEPKVYSGTFATTFHFTTDDGDVALRCFTRGHDRLEQRYFEITQFLRQVHSRTFCAAQYIPRGIHVGGAWWPVVTMDWIAGRALNVEIESKLGDGDAIWKLAKSFRGMIRSLGVLGVAHGDLQHNNILATPDGLRLIDYDAMFVPALSGLSQSEYGHRHYQHPLRRTAPFDGRLDRFSAIVIYTALIALSADASLWRRFNDGDNCLFRAHDFTSNGTSELFRTLLSSNATSGLTHTLLTACRMPVDAIPSLEEAIESSAGTMPTESPQSNVVPPPRPAPPRHASGPGTTPGVRSERSAAVQRPPARSRERGALSVALALAGAFAISAWPHGAIRAPAWAQRSKAEHSSTQTTAANRLAHAAMQGSWRIVEANRADGTMVWYADGVVSNGTFAVNAHKVSVGGRSATRCERRTNLSAILAIDLSPQTVRYREVNCAGTTSTGELRVDRFARSGRSFSGSFWQSGAKIGNFDAHRQ